MDCQAPTIDVIESATQLIQAFTGPFDDGGGYQFSMGGCHAALEAELAEE